MNVSRLLLHIIHISAILDIYLFEGDFTMNSFREILPEQITDNPFKLIGRDWGLVTAGDSDSFNTMTISWGGVGIMWNKPVTFAFIRPQRYTFEFIEKSGKLSICFFDEEYRKALSLCGTKSGREIDKPREAGLTPAFTDDGVPFFEEARLVLVCEKLYAQDLNEQSIVKEFVKDSYSGNDYHKMYVSEIKKVFIR